MNNWTIKPFAVGLYLLEVQNNGENSDTIILDAEQIESLKKFLETVEL